MAKVQLIAATLIFWVARPACPENFKVAKDDIGPIAVHTNMVFHGKGANITATATNDSDKVIPWVTLCVKAHSPGCLFSFWNTAPWQPGQEIRWEIASDKRLPDLWHEVVIGDGSEVEEIVTSLPAAVPKAKKPATPHPEVSRTWQIGTVLDSGSAKTFVQTGSSTQVHGSATASGSVTTHASATTFGSATTINSSGSYFGRTSGQSNSETQIHSMTIQETQLLIVTEEFLFLVNDSVLKGVGPGLHGSLGRAIANRKHGCHVIINDPVSYYLDRAFMYLADVDGKVCKMEIAKQERIIRPTSSSAP